MPSSIDGNGVVADMTIAAVAPRVVLATTFHAAHNPSVDTGTPPTSVRGPCATNGIARANTMNGVTTARRASTRRAPIRETTTTTTSTAASSAKTATAWRGVPATTTAKATVPTSSAAGSSRWTGESTATWSRRRLPRCEPDTVRAPPCLISSTTSCGATSGAGPAGWRW